MELDWTTFLLEIINFLVLVWILTHFLFRPVLGIIAQRRQSIEDTIAQTKAAQAEADALKSRYESRLEDWEKEKSVAREAQARELEAQRKAALAAQQAALDDERRKSESLAAHAVRKQKEADLADAIAQGVRFTGALLGRLKGPEVESAIIRMVLSDLETLPPSRRDALHDAARELDAVTILTAFAPGNDLKTSIDHAVADLFGKPTTYRIDDHLVAGIRIESGAWQVEASLASELEYFKSPGTSE
ncbi:MAG: F0F1 ATP synthase subunit delta [Pseudomonadales bacterium]|nr:F0F1 ATP synthase subunit delta [Pseudomonadales bacterium]